MKKAKSNLINGQKPEFGNPRHIQWLEEQRNPPIDLTTDDGLMRFVREFSDEILKFSNGDTRGMCAMVCDPLSAYMEFCGIKNQCVVFDVKSNGIISNHVCILLPDGRIVDPTANQFVNPATGKTMPHYYLGEIPDFYLTPKTKKAKP